MTAKRHTLRSNQTSMNVITIHKCMQIIMQMINPTGSHLYVSAEGELEVIQGERIIGRMGPGKAFGELAILYNCTRTASIKGKRLLSVPPPPSQIHCFQCFIQLPVRVNPRHCTCRMIHFSVIICELIQYFLSQSLHFIHFLNC